MQFYTDSRREHLFVAVLSIVTGIAVIVLAIVK